MSTIKIYTAPTMTNEEFIQFHKEAVEKMHAICKRKNADYTAGMGAFKNFAVVGEVGITDPKKGFLVRMMDKIMRINTFVEKGILLVEDESVEDTLLDLANYAILFAGYIKAEKRDALQRPEQLNKG